MQHTDKYNLSIIDPDDAFSPDALNENTRKLEDALVTHEAVVDSALKAQKLELQTADEALSGQLAAEKTRVDGQLSALTQTVAANKSAAESALAAETAQLAAAIGTGGTTARMVYGSYTGKGKYGSGNANSLDFADTLGCAPKLLVIGDSQGFYQFVAVNGQYDAYTFYDFPCVCIFTWTATGVRWYNQNGAEYQLNANRTYYYVAIA